MEMMHYSNSIYSVCRVEMIDDKGQC